MNSRNKGKKEAYIEPSRDKHPIPERIELVHNAIMSNAMHQEIFRQDSPSLSFEKV
jgi:hypothetical protein